MKGAIGVQFSGFKRSSTLGDLNSNDAGMYLGASLGAMYMFNDKVFVNLEYEWAYLSNSYFHDDEIRSAMIGLGTRF